jgi:hypothetical protein
MQSSQFSLLHSHSSNQNEPFPVALEFLLQRLHFIADVLSGAVLLAFAPDALIDFLFNLYAFLLKIINQQCLVRLPSFHPVVSFLLHYNVEMECRLAGKTDVLGENLPQHHFCPSLNPT